MEGKKKKIILGVMLFISITSVAILIYLKNIAINTNDICTQYNGEYYKLMFDDNPEDSLNNSNQLPLDSVVHTYDEYKEWYSIIDKGKAFFGETEQDSKLKKQQINDKFTKDFFENNTLVVIGYASFGKPHLETEITSLNLKGSKVRAELYVDVSGETMDSRRDLYFIPIAGTGIKNVDLKIKYKPKSNNGFTEIKKPIIYLYPTKETEVNISLSNSSLLKHTYPKYDEKAGWTVLAKPNGNLKDLKTSKNYYALYWEGIDNTRLDMSEGFVIEGNRTASFLEENLKVLGLNDREINEFIIYWLPKLENNPYNYIRFRTMEEINNYMRLDITPRPDNILRVYMDYKPLSNIISVKEQVLKSPKREGFVVVEWGGRELK